MVKLIGPPVIGPDLNSPASWNTLWPPPDPAARDQWKLGPVWNERAAGLAGVKKLSLIEMFVAVRPNANVGRASPTAIAVIISHLRIRAPPVLADPRATLGVLP